ncbi:DUF3153 domain-containing protein [Halobacillus sp. BBL2006]|uniref:DUF3153 domain-containing protein n=1 Tax=Halobacillus sp. BBL2006 TaxID=1543706 RepID=UPI00054369B9|nr:DUF3153 domain-containing protein [Halobacillus sp. BBL2006]KHE69501.1 hypothetical protein LD39_12800 [Halobacillus sp. BBL2006]
MKEISVLVTILFIVLLSGCVQGNYELKINKDKSGESTVTLGLEEDAVKRFGGQGQRLIDGLTEELESQGYKVESYTEDGYLQFEAKRTFEDVQEKDSFLTSGGMAELGLGAVISDSLNVTTEEGLFFDTYKVEADIDLRNPGILGGMQQFASNQMDLTFTLDLPISPKAHNADTVDGNELTWKINTAGTTNMMVEVGVPKITNIIVAAVVGLILIAFVLIFFLRKRKRKEE